MRRSYVREYGGGGKAEEPGEAGRLARKAEQQEEKDALFRMLSGSITIGTPEVDLAGLNGEAFNRKFTGLTPNTKVNDVIRSRAKGNLTRNKGTYTETLDIIDLDTGKSVIHKRGRKKRVGGSFKHGGEDNCSRLFRQDHRYSQSSDEYIPDRFRLCHPFFKLT